MFLKISKLMLNDKIQLVYKDRPINREIVSEEDRVLVLDVIHN